MNKNAFEIQKNIFEKIQKKPSMIFDVGANIGDITNEYDSMLHNLTIYCFEPIPNTFKKLNERYCDKSYINCYPFAVGKNTKDVQIFETVSSGSSSLYKPTPYITNSKNKGMSDGVSIINTHNVKQVSLDSFCNEKKISHIDILKMDIQGSELNALQGASTLLDEQKIDVIFCEVLFSDLYENQCYFHEIVSFLHKKNYKLFDLVFLIHSGDGKLYYGDAIFLNKEFMNKYETFV